MAIIPRIDWQWFEVFGKKCETCEGIKNLPKEHPNNLQECTCDLAVAGTQSLKY